ncbi:hypothetical protein GQX74_010666 [Glossina fuscipes]|nr:hypothetical protein GQX74_010666 [Glossina fuscipes]
MRKYDKENPGKKLLRLCISSLALPLWYDDRFQQDLLKFLALLRAIIHNTTTVCLVTIPTHLVAKYIFKEGCIDQSIILPFCRLSLPSSNDFDNTWQEMMLNSETLNNCFEFITIFDFDSVNGFCD